MVTRTTEPSRYPLVIVAALLVDTEGRVLLARTSKEEGGLFAIPGGRVEYGERIGDALRREIHEETGLILNDYMLLRVGERICSPSYRDGFQHLVYLDFLCNKWSGKMHLDQRELSGGLWVKPDEALACLPLSDGTRDLLQFFVENDSDAYGAYDE
jgi:nucleoside triphosphatase